MNKWDCIQGFKEFRKRLGKWFEKEPEGYEPQGVTWEHYEKGYIDGYEKRKQEELDEMCESL